LLIRLPDYVKKTDLDEAVKIVFTKKEIQLVKEIDLYRMSEGKSVQMLHIGPFSTEPESLKQIGLFISESKLKKNGLHHEIYLSDFRKTESAKLKTILREPVK
jgi:hypothetical protein